MKTSTGWIKLYRSITDSWIWTADEKYDKAHAFIDLLLLANHKEVTIPIKGNPTTIERGQHYTSIEKLAVRWHWDKKTVRKFLNNLKKTNTIDYLANKATGTTITILNYDAYQSYGDNQKDNSFSNVRSNGEDNSEANGQTKHEDINNNINIDNNKKNEKHSSSFDVFWSNYPRKEQKAKAFTAFEACLDNEISENQLLEACNNYASYCKDNSTDTKFIMLAANFIKNKAYKDYLNENYTPSTSNPKTSFHDFNERSYDYAELENIALEDNQS